jgi:hypothetical protein
MTKRLWIRACAAALLTALCVSASHAAMLLNEVFVNPSGTDNGREFIELRSSTDGVEAMTGLTLVVIEGEGSGAGTVDQALSLGAFSTGTNGLFLWRDSGTVLDPAPEVATTINVVDFSPDIENGTQTYAIVSDFSGAVGNDLDTNDDGVLDSTPWTSVSDAVGYIDNSGGAEFSYAAALGGVSFPMLPGGFDPEALLLVNDLAGDPYVWLLADVDSGSPTNGPFALDGTELIRPDGSTQNINSLTFATLSPGSTNPSIPEPASVALAGLALLAAFALRRDRADG